MDIDPDAPLSLFESCALLLGWVGEGAIPAPVADRVISETKNKFTLRSLVTDANRISASMARRAELKKNRQANPNHY